MGEEDIHISAWDLKRQYKVSNFGQGRDLMVTQARWRDQVVTQAGMSAPQVCSPAVAQLHKKGPRHRRKICTNSLWLYSYYTQSPPLKNINYIFIYLRVLRWLSRGTIRDRVSSWCNCESPGLRKRSKWVRTPVALLRWLSLKCSWERYKPLILSAIG